MTNIQEIASATSLPVNADFQSGYASTPEGVSKNVKLCIETGIAGLSIEDSSGDESKPLFERDIAIERVKVARAAIDKSGSGVLLTARCEAFLVGDDNAEHTVLDRLAAFADSGADCLYALGVKDEKLIAAIVSEVAPKPVNVLVSSPSPSLSVSKLTELGVRRISVGSALARVAWNAWLRSAQDIAKTGEFNSFADAASFAEINEIVS